jgi:hypothetical protein
MQTPLDGCSWPIAGLRPRSAIDPEAVVDRACSKGVARLEGQLIHVSRTLRRHAGH